MNNDNGSNIKIKLSSSHPLGGLPPEIWEKVLSHLGNDPESLFNCYKTCVSWNRILEQDKLLFLFKLVAPILKWEYLSTWEFLKCRRICKMWRSGVDQTFDKPSYLSRDSSIHHGLVPYIWYSQTAGSKLRSSADIRNFVNEVCLTPNISKNPFFHKTVQCINKNFDNNPETRRLFQDFTTLMLEYGHSVESCIYVAYGGKPESDKHIEEIFKNLPNLRSLAILKRAPGLWMDENEDDSGLDWLVQKKDLLPSLPNLVSINTYLTDAPLIAEMLLLSYGAQIESFHCDFKVVQLCAYLKGPVPEKGLRQLRDLDIFDAFGCSVFLERFLLFEMPYLRRLALEYVEVGPRKQSFLSILKIIDKCAGSLREIRLPQKLFNWASELTSSEGYCSLEITEFEKSSQIPLPLVKRLGVNLEILGCPVKTWFIQKFPKMETLYVTNYGVSYGCERSLKNQLKIQTSPFWELSQSARVIVVERAYCENFHFSRR